MYNDTWTSWFKNILFVLTHFGCEINCCVKLKVGKENGDEFWKVTLKKCGEMCLSDGKTLNSNLPKYTTYQ